MEFLGEVVHLQVQRASLKVGARSRRWYDPTPLQAVTTLELDQPGVHGITATGERLRDIHHADAHESRNRDGRNGLSLGFTSHYDAIRARFGPGLRRGDAGENVLVRSARVWSLAELQPGLVVVNAAGAELRLEHIVVAEPCVEFTRFALGLPPESVTDERVTGGLRFLGDGMRGYYATYLGVPTAIETGARLYLAR